MFDQESLKKSNERALRTVTGMCLDDYDNNITAFTNLGLMLFVVLFGTAVMCALTFYLSILYIGLTMTVLIADVVRSPDVLYTMEKCFPGAAFQWNNCEIVSQSLSVFSAYGRTAIATLVIGHRGAVQVIGAGMFVVVDLIGPSRRPEERTPLESVGDGPTANVPDYDLMPADCYEKPSAAKADSTERTFKYWKKRFNLFSMFDQGILLDEESFYSVWSEVLASYMAMNCGNIKVAVDPFCGAGGNVIQLAKVFDKVIAVDIDPHKIQMAKHNAIIYGVFDKIEFVVEDFFRMANRIKGDVIVTSPPRGGPNYKLTPIIGPSQLSLNKLLVVGKTVAPKILLHLPKNIDKFECLKMCNGMGAEVRKVENVFMDRYLNSTLLYVRFDNNNAVTDAVLKPTDIHLHNLIRKNERCRIEAYKKYLMEVDRILSGRRTSDDVPQIVIVIGPDII